MSRNPKIATVGLALLAFLVGPGFEAAADPPPNLPLLPPPDNSPPLPPSTQSPPLLPPPQKAPEQLIPVTVVPVEFRVAIADLEKQLIRSIALKVDPRAEPKLPLVVKGNERNFAVGQPGGQQDGKPVADGVAQNGQEMPANRPQLIPREPGTHPRLDRMAQRPLVAGIVNAILGTVDLTYRIELRSLKLSFSGNTLTSEIGAGFTCEGKVVQPPAGRPVPPPNVRDITLKLKVTKNLEWSDKGKLELKEGTSSIWIDPEAPIIGFPRLDIERVVRLNGLLAMLSNSLDRELMKYVTGENLPDLVKIAPTLKQKMPFLAVSELTVYPLRGDDKYVYVSLVVGLVAAKKKTDDVVNISTKQGPPPEPKLRGKITYDKDGKPEVKLDPLP
jgi:hypothetical protein